MFVFWFGVLSATRRVHGHLVQDSRTHRSFGLLDLGRTKGAFVSLRFGPRLIDPKTFGTPATRWTTQNIATEPMAQRGTSSAQRSDAAYDAISVGTKETCPISTPTRINFLTNR